MTHKIELPEVPEYAPEPPPHGPRIWLQKNLFSTPASSVLSIVFIAIAIAGLRGMLGFIFDEVRRWEAVTFNVRLLMVRAYPEDQLTRVWFAVAVAAVLIAATFALYQVTGRTSPRKVGNALSTIGGFFLAAGLLGPWGLVLNPFGVESGTTFAIVFGTGAVLSLGGQAFRKAMGAQEKDERLPVMGVVLGALIVVLIGLWTIELPWPDRLPDGTQISVTEPIEMSTRVPWTVIFALSILTYLLVAMFRDRLGGIGKKVLTSAWVLSFPVLFLVVLRDPGLDMGRVFTWYIPVALGFIIIGGFILNFVADSRGELGRVIGAVLLLVAFAGFFFSLEFIVRWSLMGLAVFALAAPTFGGKGSGRRAFLGAWLGFVVVIVFFVMLLSAPSTIEVPGGGSPFGGLLLTILLSTVAIVLSLPLGIILALGRSSKLPIFRLMSTAYIELIRGVPLITWLIVGFIMLPVALPEGIEIGGVARAIGAMSLFSAAYLAENVRGGLQSIPKGQYEASQAMGLTIMQTTVFIVLPQALRAVIPALVGQVIALFKDTSLVTIVGLFDFLHIARAVIPGQAQPFNFIGVFREPLLFAALVYWMFTFTFSRISLRLEKRLGVGER
jgi:general L-amino acid transport system permease protein